jgi:hypothetical protein
VGPTFRRFGAGDASDMGLDFTGDFDLNVDLFYGVWGQVQPEGRLRNIVFAKAQEWEWKKIRWSQQRQRFQRHIHVCFHCKVKERVPV